MRNSDHNTSPAHTTRLHVVCALALNSHAAQAASVEAEEGAAELRYRQHTQTHACCSRRPPRPSLTPRNRHRSHACGPAVRATALRTPLIHTHQAKQRHTHRRWMGESCPAKAGPPAREAVGHTSLRDSTYTLCTAPTLGVVGAKSAPTSHCTCQLYSKHRSLKQAGHSNVWRFALWHTPCVGSASSHLTPP